MAQRKGQVVQDLFSINGLRKPFYSQHFIANLTVRPEVDVGVLPAGRLDFIQLDLFQGTLPGGSLLGLGRVGTESGNKFLQLLDLFFLLFIRFLHLPDNELAGLIPEVIVSGVELDLTVVDVRNLGADLVQEITVMGNHDHRIFKIDQKFLQPCDGVQVQMVGRLVQQQDIRVAEQCLRQQHLDFLRTGQVPHGFVMKLRIDPQAVQQGGSVGFRLPAVHGSKFPFQLAGLDPILIGEILFRIDGVFFLHDLIKAGISHNDRVQNGIFVVLGLVLLQEGETFSRSNGDLPVGRLELPGQDLQKGRLSRAVGADDAVAVSFGEFDVHIFK